MVSENAGNWGIRWRSQGEATLSPSYAQLQKSHIQIKGSEHLKKHSCLNGHLSPHETARFSGRPHGSNALRIVQSWPLSLLETGDYQ